MSESTPRELSIGDYDLDIRKLSTRRGSVRRPYFFSPMQLDVQIANQSRRANHARPENQEERADILDIEKTSEAHRNNA